VRTPDFLTLDDVLMLHADRVKTYGGAMALRDRAALESAIAMPTMTFAGAFLHPTLPEMAAAYLFHLCQAHAFMDGNKRVALAAALAFLHLNGHELVADPEALYELVIGVAAGRLSKADAAVFMAAHVRAVAGPRRRRGTRRR
jgi:death-on-curing protein